MFPDEHDQPPYQGPSLRTRLRQVREGNRAMARQIRKEENLRKKYAEALHQNDMLYAKLRELKVESHKPTFASPMAKDSAFR